MHCQQNQKGITRYAKPATIRNNLARLDNVFLLDCDRICLQMWFYTHINL